MVILRPRPKSGSQKVTQHLVTVLAPKATCRLLQLREASSNEYRVTFASKSFRPIYMIEAEVVVWAADTLGENIILKKIA